MRFIIIGCGRMGSGLAGALDSHGHEVTLIDKDHAVLERLDQSSRARMIVGNGFDRKVLLEAGIERTDGLAAVTNSDETNIVLARLARLVFHVPRVVARLYDPLKMEIYQRLGVQIVAPVKWAINRLADLLSYSELDTILSMGNGEVEIVEVEVPPLLVGRKLSALNVPGEVHVIALSRRGKSFLPTSETVFQRNDSVQIALPATSIERLRGMLALG